MLVVLHRSESYPDLLPRILQNVSSLPVAAALHGEALEAGRIYVAPLITMCWCAQVTAKSCAGRA